MLFRRPAVLIGLVAATSAISAGLLQCGSSNTEGAGAGLADGGIDQDAVDAATPTRQPPATFCSDHADSGLCVDFQQESITKGFRNGALGEAATAQDPSQLALVAGMLRATALSDGGSSDGGGALRYAMRSQYLVISFDFRVAAAPAAGRVTAFRTTSLAGVGPRLFIDVEVASNGGLALVAGVEGTSRPPGAGVHLDKGLLRRVVFLLNTFMAPDNPYSTAVGLLGDNQFAFEDVVTPAISAIEVGALDATADGFQLDFDNLTVESR